MSGNLTILAGDLAGLLAACVLASALLLLPGALLARALERLIPNITWRGFAPALAIALLPAFDALATKIAGIPATTAWRVALAIAACVAARAYFPRPGRIAALGIAAWLACLAVFYVDVDWDRQLYQSLTVLDLVKHAAVVRELVQHGVPLSDPFFDRVSPAGYYHYFYHGAAAIDWLGGSLIDARMAFVGAAFACGIAFASMLRAFVVALGWKTVSDRRLTALVVLVCIPGGLDVFGLLFRWLAIGEIEPSAEWWDDEISFFVVSAAWVPHHLAGVIASFMALFLLATGLDAETRAKRAAFGGLAGVAMASAFGLSIWVTVGAAAVIALSLRFLPAGHRLGWIRLAAIATAIALVLSAHQFGELAFGRANAGAPLALWIRDPARISEMIGQPLFPLVALALAPVIWFLEFGVFAVGAALFWQRGQPETQPLFARLLVASTVAGLLMNLLVRSTIINNDFGWRIAWFAALPAMLWTLSVLQARPVGRGERMALAATFAIGVAATAYNIAAARFIRSPPEMNAFDFINSDRPVDYGLERAYRWAAAHLPEDAALQHNPAVARRSFAFGLYGVQPTMVADGLAGLFGAPQEVVERRVAFFGRIFAGELPPSAAPDVHLVVTVRDPLWRKLPASACLYHSDTVCITRAEGS